jgi:hypothetical protein
MLQTLSLWQTITGAGVQLVGRLKRNWVMQPNAIGWCTYLQLGGAFELQLPGALEMQLSGATNANTQLN